MLTQALLKKYLRYDQRTGIFVRIYSQYRTDFIGKKAGYIMYDGYIRVYVHDKTYLAHRLAWFYMTGAWPKEIDHKNNKRDDNRWKNLRETTRSNNRGNSRVSPNTKSGVKGVRLFKGRCWQARILNKHLGYFSTLAKAKAAYAAAAKKHFGEFARV